MWADNQTKLAGLTAWLWRLFGHLAALHFNNGPRIMRGSFLPWDAAAALRTLVVVTVPHFAALGDTNTLVGAEELTPVTFIHGQRWW